MYTDGCIHCHHVIHDVFVKIEFQIQILYNCLSFNADSVYTISVGKINTFKIKYELLKSILTSTR